MAISSPLFRAGLVSAREEPRKAKIGSQRANWRTHSPARAELPIRVALLLERRVVLALGRWFDERHRVTRGKGVVEGGVELFVDAAPAGASAGFFRIHGGFRCPKERAPPPGSCPNVAALWAV